MTIYGRNASKEALEDTTLTIYRLHLATSNRPTPQLDKMVAVAKSRGVEILYHSKRELSHISKNSKQDQGVALDIILPYSSNADEFIRNSSSYRVMVLDSIHNPQNLGMIIRSASAGYIDAVILPTKNSAQISPLVIKSSAGTLFKLPIIRTDSLIKTVKKFKKDGATLYTLSSHAKRSYRDEVYQDKTLFIVGNETNGVSQNILNISDRVIKIPMNRGVKSLNVAVTASLLAFL
jgi:23S rRNA (guanosine2251-2'-O)-methyltransferase